MTRDELVGRAHSFTAAVTEQWTALCLAASADTPMSTEVHQFRVALRRLRSIARLLLGGVAKKLRTKSEVLLRETAEVTGEARDEEVLAETLDDLKLPQTTRAPLRVWQTGRARRLRGTTARAVETLRSQFGQRVRRTLAVVDAAIDGLGEDFASPTSLGILLRDRIETLRSRWTHALETGDSEAFHRARISAKKLRYLCEWLTDDATLPLHSLSNACAKIQKILGRVHDLDEAALRMDRARGLSADHRGIVLAEIARQSMKVTKKAREDVTRVVGTLEDLCMHALAGYAASTGAIEERRDPLPDPDAERSSSPLVTEPDHVEEQGRDDAGARTADGMAQRDGSS